MYNVYKILPCIKEIWNATKCRYTIDQKSNFRFEFYYISSKLINHRYPLQLPEFRFFHTNYWINDDLKLLIGSVRFPRTRSGETMSSGEIYSKRGRIKSRREARVKRWSSLELNARNVDDIGKKRINWKKVRVEISLQWNIWKFLSLSLV